MVIRRVGQESLNFAGVGGSTVFASGEENQYPCIGTGSALAGNGSISLFASVFANRTQSGGNGGLNSIGVEANASLTDTFTITTASSESVALKFALHAQGSTSFSRADGISPFNFTPSAKVSWAVSLTGPGGTLSSGGSVLDGWGLVSTNPLVPGPVHQETGIGFGEFALVVGAQPGSLGTTFSLSMSATATAGLNAGGIGQPIGAVADFGNTLRWLGLESATLPDGSAYTGPITITSDSGFNYLTPTPGAGSALMMLGGLAVRRRRA